MLLPGDVLVFHQNVKGIQRGQRVKVTKGVALPLDHPDRFSVYHQGELKLAAGERVRITNNGRTMDGKHRLENGSIYGVKGFDKAGNILLDNDWTVSKDFGHLDYGYVVTSHNSQGRTVQQVFIGQSYESMPASSQEQFYVSVSRGKEKATIYCGNKAELLEAVGQTDERLSASEMIGDRPDRHRLPVHEHSGAMEQWPRLPKPEMTYER